MKKNEQKVFTFINNNELISIIDAAHRHIIYAAPSIAESVANAIFHFTEKNPDAAVRLIIDANAESFRLGFGDHAGLKMLAEKRFDIRCAPGLRIAVLIADEEAWVYSPTPEVIFEQPDAKINNAVKVNVEFAKQILFSVAPDISVVPKTDEVLEDSIIIDDKDNRDTAGLSKIEPEAFEDESSKRDILDEQFITDELVPEIGREKLTEQNLKTIEHELRENPPQQFDLTRKVRVYQGHFQFVELKFMGCHFKGKTITLPKHLLNVSDKEFQKRLKTTCRILEEDNLFSIKVDLLEEKVKKLRKDFVKSLGERYGTVILRREREKFSEDVQKITEELDTLKNTIKEDLENEIQKSQESLVELLLPALVKNPPPQFIGQSNKVDEGWLKLYLEAQIDKQMPQPEQLIKDMDFYCNYKDVTYETLNDQKFIDAVNNHFPNEKFEKLYSEEETIAEKEKKIER